MLLTKEVEITLNSVMIPYYKKLGYLNLKKNQQMTIPIQHLNKGSNYFVDVKCDICNEITKVPYKIFLKLIEFDGLYYCRKNKCFTLKVKRSSLKKYGVENTSQSEFFKKKLEKTIIEKYGCKNVFQNEDVKNKIKQFYRENYNGAEWNTQVKYVRDKNGWIPDEQLSEWEKYKKLCKKYTNNNKKMLFDNWNGYDYYDGEYIRDNKIFNYYYPTIDHKISIKYGFLNNISEIDICDITNLCVTKLGLNSSKRMKNDKEFIELKKLF